MAGRSPTPLKEKLKENLIPILLQKKNRIRACAMTPSVEEPASRTISAPDHCSTVLCHVGSAPKIRRKATQPISPTRLLRTGAHIKGPK